jgi:hypothetical protein
VRGEIGVRYATSIHAFSTSSVMPTYLDELSGFESWNLTGSYSTSCIAGAGGLLALVRYRSGIGYGQNMPNWSISFAAE